MQEKLYQKFSNCVIWWSSSVSLQDTWLSLHQSSHATSGWKENQAAWHACINSGKFFIPSWIAVLLLQHDWQPQELYNTGCAESMHTSQSGLCGALLSNKVKKESHSAETLRTDSAHPSPLHWGSERVTGLMHKREYVWADCVSVCLWMCKPQLIRDARR